MQIQIQAHGFTLTQGLVDHIERRIAQSLAHIRDDIRKVAVRLSDINGPRGGNDKRCVVQISLHGHKGVVAKDIHGDMYLAISHAAFRAAHTVKKLLGRKRAQRHSAPEDETCITIDQPVDKT